MKRIVFDSRWQGNHGIGRFARELRRLLPQVEDLRISCRPSHPLDPFLLGTVVRWENPDLFCSPGYNPPIGFSRPFVFTLHDLNHLRVAANSSSAKRAYYRYIVRPACHKAAFVLTVSEFSREDILQWSGLAESRVLNVGNGVGSPFGPEGPRYDPGYPYLLYVGSRRAHKNIDRLLRAFAISKTSCQVKLMMTGSWDAAIDSQITSLGLSEKVAFVNPVADADLAAVYRGAVALVFPSLYEGFGLPPLESMACGVPVLASNVCSLPEVVADAGLLVDPLSTDAIAAGIRRLVESDSLRHQLSKKGIQRSAQFSWQSVACKTSKALHAAMESN